MLARLVIIGLAAIVSVAPMRASAALPFATIDGTVRDVAGKAIASASIELRNGTLVERTQSDGSGAFHAHIAAGTIAIVATRGGFRPTDDEYLVAAGGTGTVVIVMQEATTTSLNVIGRVASSRNTALSMATAAITSLGVSTIADRSSTNLIETLPALVPGLTLARFNSATPNNFFAIRGGFYETRIEIDGHPLSSGTFGSWNVNYSNPFTFGDVEISRGPGSFGAGAGESAFGTVNLRTRDFTPTDSAQAKFGYDSYGGSYSSLFSSVDLAPRGRLQFLAMHNYTGYNGPNQDYVAARANASNTLVNYVANFSSPYRLSSDVVKLRARFSEGSALTLAFIGLDGEYAPQGGAYGSYQGTHAILPCAPDPTKCTLFSTYNAPSAASLIGKTIPLYAFSSNSVLQNYQPLFEAEFRAAIGRDTMLVRPYVTTLSRSIDGSRRPEQPGFAGAWYKIIDGSRCAGATVAPDPKTGKPASGPCFQGNAPTPMTKPTASCNVLTPCYAPTTAIANDGTIGYAVPFETLERDTLHGLTFSYFHPFGEHTVAFTYDYRSDATASSSGDPTPLSPANSLTLATSPLSIPTTTSRNNDLGLQFNLAAGPRLHVNAGAFMTNWSLQYQFEDPVLFAKLQRKAPIALLSAARGYAHIDPQIGLTYRASPTAIVRLSGGSAVTIPYAGQVSGLPGIDYPNGVNNFTGTVTLRNPNLLPETTVAYDLGADLRILGGGVASLDAFSNTVHDTFINDRVPYTGPPISGGGAFFQSTTLNGPLQRNYGLELALRKLPQRGFGYRFNATLQRDFYDGLPKSFYAAQQTAVVNGKQLDGSPAVVPYTSAGVDLQYTAARDTLVLLGAHYVGANNAYFGPAVTLFNGSARREIAAGVAVQISIDNLTNLSTGTPYGQGTSNLGFSQITYGAAKVGGPQTYGSLPTSLQTIQPRTVRFELQLNAKKATP